MNNRFKNRDERGRFVKKTRWDVIFVTIFFVLASWIWISQAVKELERDRSLPPKTIVYSEKSEPIVVFDKVGNQEAYESGFRDGLAKGNEDTIKILVDLTREGHPWDYTEIKKRLEDLNPSLQ